MKSYQQNHYFMEPTSLDQGMHDLRKWTSLCDPLSWLHISFVSKIAAVFLSTCVYSLSVVNYAGNCTNF